MIFYTIALYTGFCRHVELEVGTSDCTTYVDTTTFDGSVPTRLLELDASAAMNTQIEIAFNAANSVFSWAGINNKNNNIIQ